LRATSVFSGEYVHAKSLCIVSANINACVKKGMCRWSVSFIDVMTVMMKKVNRYVDYLLEVGSFCNVIVIWYVMVDW